MKKLVLMLAVAFSMSFVACGNKEAAADAANTAADSVEVVTNEVVAAATGCACPDSCQCPDSCTCNDTIVEAAAAVVAEPEAK